MRGRLMSGALPNALRWDITGNNWVPDDSYGPRRDSVATRPKVRRWRLWLLVLIASVASAGLTFGCAAVGTALLHLAEATPFEGAGGNTVYRLALQSFFALWAYLSAIGVTVHTGRQLGQFIGGSGIPELKCELGGVHLVGLFDFRVLVGKLLGLSFAIGAGLPVGTEGPFVHASACVSHNMMLLFPVFQDLLGTRKLRLMSISAMVAVGVACTFTAPLGGVLYALEVTDAFHASNYVPCFFGATIAGVVNTGLRYLMPLNSPFFFNPLFVTNLKPIELTHWEFAAMLTMYTLFGALCGVFGALFVQAHKRVMKWLGRVASSKDSVQAPEVEVVDGGVVDDYMTSTRTSTETMRRRFISAYVGNHRESDMSLIEDREVSLRKRKLYFAIMVTLVGFANTALCWVVPALHNYATQPRLLNALTSIEEVDWGGAQEIHVALTFVIKFVTTVVVLALPIPMGSVAPAFVLGAILGRGVGYVCRPICDWQAVQCSKEMKEEFLPRMALIGASSFVAGSMQSFAQVIVVFERTCLPEMLLPLCASALVAIFTAQLLSKNFFDSIIEMKKLPHLPALGQGRSACIVEQIMRKDFPVLPISIGAEAIIQARLRFPGWQYEVPVVDAPECRMSPQRCPVDIKAGDRLIVLKSLLTLPDLEEDMDQVFHTPTDKARVLLKDATSAVLVSHMTPLKALLPMLTSLERTTAFVTQQGYLVGAVTMTDLYTFACGQRVVEAWHGARSPLIMDWATASPSVSRVSSNRFALEEFPPPEDDEGPAPQPWITVSSPRVTFTLPAHEEEVEVEATRTAAEV